MVRYAQMIDACRKEIEELFPWDLVEVIEAERDLMLLDVREPYEFTAMHIEGSLNVPRGILEQAAEYGFEETVPELVEGRGRDVIVLCRSGNRSLLAAHTLWQMGFQRVRSLRTGLKGWNDYDQPLVDAVGRMVSIDESDDHFTPRVTAEQVGPRP